MLITREKELTSYEENTRMELLTSIRFGAHFIGCSKFRTMVGVFSEERTVYCVVFDKSRVRFRAETHGMTGTAPS